MSRSTTLQQALIAWTAQGPAIPSGPHLTTAQLYEWLLDPAKGEIHEPERNHLVRCPRCSGELWRLTQARKEAAQSSLGQWDVALPKAAASEMDWPKRIVTEHGHFVIEIRRSLDAPQRGVITVIVDEAARLSLEGHLLRVTDGRGQLLLQGPVFEGRVSQLIESGLDDIVPRFAVRTD